MVQHSWRSAEQPGPFRSRRFLRIGVALLLASLLVGWATLLISPFFAPRTHLFLLAPTRQPSPGLPIVEYSDQDVAGFLSLGQRRGLRRAPAEVIRLNHLRSAAAMQGLSADLQRSLGRAADVLVLYVRAPLASEGGKPYLLCDDFDARSAAPNKYPWENLLDQVRGCPAAVKLLVVDACLPDDDWRGDEQGSGIPQQIRDSVVRQDDPTLWMIVSHSELEKSRVSRSLERSVFGYFMAQGLDGAADANGDQRVALDELWRYVASHVASVVQSASDGYATQTVAELVWGGGSANQPASYPVLARVSLLGPLTENERLAAAQAEAMKSSRGAAYQSLVAPATSRAAISRASGSELLSNAGAFTKLPAAASATPPSALVTAGKAAAGLRSPPAESGKAPAESPPPAPAGARVPGPEPTPHPDRAATPPTTTPLAARSSAADQGPSFEQSNPTPGDNESTPAEPPKGGLTPPIEGNSTATAPADKGTAKETPESRAARRMASLLAEAWQLRDTLAARTPGRETPVDFAPHAWSHVQWHLLRYDRLFRAGRIDQPAFGNGLEDLLASLRELSARRPITGPPDDPVRRVAELRFAGWPSAAAAFSLGFAEQLAQHSGQPLGPQLSSRAQTLESFAAGGPSAAQQEFQEWATRSLSADDERWIELRLARRLSLEAEVPWAEQQLALRARRAAERAAAGSIESLPWVHTRIEAADRQRVSGERELFDRVGAGWQQRARRRLTAAIDAYGQAVDDGQAVFLAEQRCRDLLDRVPQYMRWRLAAGNVPQPPVPSYESLSQLLQTLAHTLAVLESPDASRLDEVRRLDTQLGNLQREIENGLEEESLAAWLDSSGDAWQIESLLSTTLPRASARLRLLAAAAEIEARGLAQTSFAGPREVTASSPADASIAWRSAVRQVRLEQQLAYVAVFRASPDGVPQEPEFSEYRQFVAAAESLQQRATANAEEVTTAALEEVQAAWRRMYAALPSEIERLAQEATGQAAEAPRDARRHALQRAIRALRCAAARDARAIGQRNPQGELREVKLHEHLAWQRQRLLRERDDAPQTEVAYLTSTAEACREEAIRRPGQPEIRPDFPPALMLSGPSEVSLGDVSEADVPLVIHNTGSQSARVWLLLQYDAQMVQLESPEGRPVYREHALEAELRDLAERPNPPHVPVGSPDSLTPEREAESLRIAAEYPYRPDVFAQPPTWQLHSGESASLTIRLRRLPAATQPTRLIAKVIGVADGRECYVRHSIELELPASDALQLLIAGTPGSWTEDNARLLLRLFPNRATSYQFQLRQPGLKEKPVEVQLLATGRRVTARLPRGSLAFDDAERLLQGFGTTQLLVPPIKMTLPAGNQPRGIPFSLPEKAPAAVTVGEQAAAPATDAAKPAELAGEAPSQPLPGDLLIIVTDVETGRRTMRYLPLSVQRPRRFLQPRVSYDPERERVEIRLAPADPGLLPSTPVRVHAEFAGDVPPGTQIQLDGELSVQHPEIQMFAPMPSERGRLVTLHLSVDDYPRAFVYDVPCWGLTADIPDRRDLLNVRITGLPQGRSYRTPTGEIPVELQVDAPEGAFEDDESALEVGLDQDRDRELSGEPRLTLHADRQVELSLAHLGAEGQLSISTRVSDFRVAVPPSNIRSARVAVLAELSAAGRRAWSQPEEIVLDGSPPRLLQPRLKPGAEVAPGGEWTLSVLANDDGLSGVAKVEAALDVKQVGMFVEDPKPVEAVLDPEGGYWQAKLPAGELKPGSYRLLMRATDQVGNVGEYSNLIVRVLPADAAEAKNTNRVAGSVRHGEEPVAGVELKLEGEKLPPVAPVATNGQGLFEFAQVPPGKYKLTARGLLYNKFRTTQAEVEVPPPPAQVPLQELRLP